MSTQKRYIAFLDILGFKAIMQNLSTDVLGDQMANILQSSILSALTGETVFVGRNPDLNVSSSIKVYQFSDSIILYTEDDTEESIRAIVEMLNKLLAQSAIRGFPLRGALTCGEVFISGSIVVGDPLVEATIIESSQEWSGVIVECSLDPLVKQGLLNEKLIVEHEVTLKDPNNKGQLMVAKKHVINWPQYAGMKGGTPVDFKKAMTRFTGMPTGQKEIDKIERTVEFYEKNIGSKVLPDFRFGIGRIIFNEDGEPLFLKED